MEAWLVPQTRTITDADRRPIELEQTTLFWELFDELVEEHQFTEARLIQLGRDGTTEFGLPFELGIQDAVSHLYKAWSTHPPRDAQDDV